MKATVLGTVPAGHGLADVLPPPGYGAATAVGEGCFSFLPLSAAVAKGDLLFPADKVYAPGDDDADEFEDDDADDVDDDAKDDDDKEPIRNADKKARSDEAAKYRVQARKEKEGRIAAEAQVKELTDKQTADGDLAATVKELRIHNAFLVAAVGKVTDLDATWKLVDHSKVVVDEKGNVGSFDELIATALDKYPYLAPADEGDKEPFQPLATDPSGRPLNGKKSGKSDPSRAILEGKFPALRQRR